jgi:hypothetical protein
LTPAEEWARCKSWIADGLEFAGGLYDIEDVERKINSGEMVFLPAPHCAVVMEVMPFPNAKILNVFSGGGEPGEALREYKEIVDPFIADFAKRMGCKEVWHHCRKSGERVGRSLGYVHRWSIMVKEIT